MERVRLILAYLAITADAAFFILCSFKVGDDCSWGAVVMCVLGISIASVPFDKTLNGKRNQWNFNSESVMGSPIVDLIAISICVMGLDEWPGWDSIEVFGLVALSIDLLRWILKKRSRKSLKRSYEQPTIE